MFCGKLCQRDIKHPERSDFHEVTTLRFEGNVLSACQKRDDAVSWKVSLRVSSCSDLVAEVRYHNSWRSTFKKSTKNFLTGDQSSKQLPGRPEENEKSTHFEQLCEWMQSATQ